MKFSLIVITKMLNVLCEFIFRSTSFHFSFSRTPKIQKSSTYSILWNLNLIYKIKGNDQRKLKAHKLETLVYLQAHHFTILTNRAQLLWNWVFSELNIIRPNRSTGPATCSNDQAPTIIVLLEELIFAAAPLILSPVCRNRIWKSGSNSDDWIRF